jgi:hypothetical protein
MEEITPRFIEAEFGKFEKRLPLGLRFGRLSHAVATDTRL